MAARGWPPPRGPNQGPGESANRLNSAQCGVVRDAGRSFGTGYNRAGHHPWSMALFGRCYLQSTAHSRYL
jgi:hypothetical protein